MKRIHLPLYAEGRVHGAIMTIHCDCMRWTEEYQGALKQTLEVIDSVYSEESESNEKLVVVKTGSEMENTRKHGKFSVLMGLEGGKAIEGNLEVLRCLFRLGVRSVARKPTRSRNPWRSSVPRTHQSKRIGMARLPRTSYSMGSPKLPNIHLRTDLAGSTSKGTGPILEPSKLSLA